MPNTVLSDFAGRAHPEMIVRGSSLASRRASILPLLLPSFMEAFFRGSHRLLLLHAGASSDTGLRASINNSEVLRQMPAVLIIAVFNDPSDSAVMISSHTPFIGYNTGTIFPASYVFRGIGTYQFAVGFSLRMPCYALRIRRRKSLISGLVRCPSDCVNTDSALRVRVGPAERSG